MTLNNEVDVTELPLIASL